MPLFRNTPLLEFALAVNGAFFSGFYTSLHDASLSKGQVFPEIAARSVAVSTSYLVSDDAHAHDEVLIFLRPVPLSTLCTRFPKFSILRMATRLVLVDDTDPLVQYHGNWFADKGSNDLSGSYGKAYNSTLHGTRSNSSLSFTFSGTWFESFLTFV